MDLKRAKKISTWLKWAIGFCILAEIAVTDPQLELIFVIITLILLAVCGVVMMGYMKCPACGTRVGASDKNCPKCRKKLPE